MEVIEFAGQDDWQTLHYFVGPDELVVISETYLSEGYDAGKHGVIKIRMVPHKRLRLTEAQAKLKGTQLEDSLLEGIEWVAKHKNRVFYVGSLRSEPKPRTAPVSAA